MQMDLRKGRGQDLPWQHSNFHMKQFWQQPRKTQDNTPTKQNYTHTNKYSGSHRNIGVGYFIFDYHITSISDHKKKKQLSRNYKITQNKNRNSQHDIYLPLTWRYHHLMRRPNWRTKWRQDMLKSIMRGSKTYQIHNRTPPTIPRLYNTPRIIYHTPIPTILLQILNTKNNQKTQVNAYHIKRSFQLDVYKQHLPIRRSGKRNNTSPNPAHNTP